MFVSNYFRRVGRVLKTLVPALVPALAAAGFAIASPGAAFAQMGPDYWRVHGVPANDTLNIRSGPSTSYRVITAVPNGTVFRNLGCQGSGNARWCQLETPNGQMSGWAAGRYLVESGAPNSGSTAAQNDVPELFVRNSGEIEVRFASGCTALYNPAGRRISAGGSCSRAQRSRANDAVKAHMRETANSGNHEGGGGNASVNISGSGTVVKGGPLTGRIFGHREGHYAFSMNGDGLVCTGQFKHVPGSVKAESTSIHCTNGASGTAILGQRGRLLTFNLSNGKGGLISF